MDAEHCYLACSVYFLVFFRPNVCSYQDMEMVVVRQPCVQAFTRLVKVWKPHCGYTRNWCVGYERRSVAADTLIYLCS